MEKQINAWLRKYARTFYDKELECYADCDMVDSCMLDLSLDESHRATVNRLVDYFIATN